MTRIRVAGTCVLLLLIAGTAAAEVVRIDVRRRDDFGTHERIIGRVYFAIDPSARANRGIADVRLAPRNAAGRSKPSSCWESGTITFATLTSRFHSAFSAASPAFRGRERVRSSRRRWRRRASLTPKASPFPSG